MRPEDVRTAGGDPPPPKGASALNRQAGWRGGWVAREGSRGKGVERVMRIEPRLLALEADPGLALVPLATSISANTVPQKSLPLLLS